MIAADVRMFPSECAMNVFLVPGSFFVSFASASAVLKAGDSFYNMSEEELLDAICCTAPSKDVRMYLEYFAKHGRLHDLVREAQLSAVSRILEGSE